MGRNASRAALLPIAAFCSLWIGCTSQAQRQESPQTAAVSRPLGCSKHERLHSVLWMQQSGEFKANALQAFSLAAVRLDQALKDPSAWRDAVEMNPEAPKGKYAIIVDVDETVLDNTPEEVQLILSDKRKFDEAIWKEWESRGNAAALVGAVEFLKYAERRGVKVFYVTNRSNEESLRTNLASKGFPLAEDTDAVLVQGEFPTGTSRTDKEGRRQEVARNFRVLMSVGDDLADFMRVSGFSVAERIEKVQNAKASWGYEWIILPNPSYGSWERAFYDPSNDKDDVILEKKCQALEAPKP